MGLPEGWVETTIDDISIKCLQRKPDADESLVYVDIGSINRETKRISTPQKLIGSDAPSRARRIIKENDILVSLTRPNLNAVALVTEEFDNQFASTGFEVIRPVGVDSGFIFALVKCAEFIDAISGKVQGALYPAAKSADVRGFKLSLPPLNEQIRIANKLDSLLAKVETAQDRLEKIPVLLKRFRQSVLAAATSGELMREWRDGADSGGVIKVAGITTEIKYGTSKKCGYETGDTPVLRIPNMGVHGIELSDLKYAFFDEKELLKLRLQKGDILVIRSNGSLDLVGRASLVTEKAVGYLYAGYLIRLRIDLRMAIPKYILFSLQSPVVRKAIELTARSTSGVNNINSKELAELSFCLPSLKEQAEIVRRVESLFTQADKVEAQYQTAKTRLDKLTQSILAKAFRGELVPQDPNDEPASELLKRIQAERENQPKKRS